MGGLSFQKQNAMNRLTYWRSTQEGRRVTDEKVEDPSFELANTQEMNLIVKLIRTDWEQLTTNL
jgi:hypothetical protein